MGLAADPPARPPAPPLAGWSGLARRTAGLYAGLLLATALAWAWALAAFGASPALLGTATLAWLLGLRHAVDADHVAAIDNTTRKLMQRGDRPLTVGLYFSLGHSTVVVLACVGVALASGALRGWLARMSGPGAVIGTGVSAGFLLLIALANTVTAASVWRAWRASRHAGAAAAMDIPPPPGGPLARLLRPLLAVIGRPWHMYPLGFLFGLGFDTATEVGLLAISASQAAHHLPMAEIMIFPALFTVGMTLVDTTDGVLMVGAYGWAFVHPRRKLFYNLAITVLSVAIAAAIGTAEAAQLIGDRLKASGPLWGWTAAFTAHMGAIGCAIIALFAICWAASAAVGRMRASADPALR